MSKPTTTDEPSLVDLFLRDREGRIILAVSALTSLAIMGWVVGIIPGIVLGVAAAVVVGVGVPALFLLHVMSPWSQT